MFYALLVVDAAGVPHERLEALAELKRAAQVPIFGLFESELGHGVLGGPYNVADARRQEAARGAATLSGGAASGCGRAS